MNDLWGLQTNTFLGLENLKELHLQGNNFGIPRLSRPGRLLGWIVSRVLCSLKGGTICGTLHATGKLPQSVTCW